MKSGGFEEELDLPLNKRKEKDSEIIHWVYVVRIVLSICLIYYHNHRLVDSYRHNLNIEIPTDYFTLQSLIKQSQRMALQAGLNLVSQTFSTPVQQLLQMTIVMLLLTYLSALYSSWL